MLFVAALAAAAVAAEPRLAGHRMIDGDVMIPDEVSDEDYFAGRLHARAGRAAVLTERRWPNRIMYYELDPSLNDFQVEDIFRAFAHWQTKTDIVFVERAQEQGYVRIFRDPAGFCFATIGHYGFQSSIGLGDFCGYSTIIHEIGHAAGFYHQHTRADRDDYVEILYDNIIPEQQHNFRKYTSGVDVLEYDFESVMHYSSRAWRKADAEGEYTILALDPQYQDTMGGYDLSPLDAQKVKIMYDEVQPDACIHTVRAGESIDRMIETYQVFRGLTNLNWNKVRKLNKDDIEWGLCPDADTSEPIFPFVDDTNRCDVICGFNEFCTVGREEDCPSGDCPFFCEEFSGRPCDEECGDNEWCYFPPCQFLCPPSYCLPTECDGGCADDEQCILWQVYTGEETCWDDPPVPVCVPTTCEEECGENQKCLPTECRACEEDCIPTFECFDVPQPPCVQPDDELRMCDEPVVPGPDSPLPTVVGGGLEDPELCDRFKGFPVTAEVEGRIQSETRIEKVEYVLLTREKERDDWVYERPDGVLSMQPYTYETRDFQRLDFFTWEFSAFPFLFRPYFYALNMTIEDEFGRTGHGMVEFDLAECQASVSGNFERITFASIGMRQTSRELIVFAKLRDPTREQIWEGETIGFQGRMFYPDGEIRNIYGTTQDVIEKSLPIRRNGITKFCFENVVIRSLRVTYEGDVACAILHVFV